MKRATNPAIFEIDEANSMAKDLLKTMLLNAPAQCEPPSSLEKAKRLFPDKEIAMIEVTLP